MPDRTALGRDWPGHGCRQRRPPDRSGERPAALARQHAVRFDEVTRREEENEMDDRDTLPRSILPIPDQPRTGLVTYDAKDPETKFPPIRQLRPPSGAPNVLIVLLDDVGFGAS